MARDWYRRKPRHTSHRERQNLVVCCAISHLDGLFSPSSWASAWCWESKALGWDFFPCFSFERRLMWLRNMHKLLIDTSKFEKTSPGKTKYSYWLSLAKQARNEGSKKAFTIESFRMVTSAIGHIEHLLRFLEKSFAIVIEDSTK